ncbi:MAG: hypothetical protein U9Q40_05800 [Campylobacterota bacterium]|nr:hypothetical protein [Campylobacterota bacterium]
MDLKDFIKETVIQISESVVEIQEHFDDKNIDAIINPRELRANRNKNYSAEYSTTAISPTGNEYSRKNVARNVDNIEFDVAVTVESDSKSNLGGKLKVFDIGVGAEVNEVSKQANLSKVKFKIPMVLPHGKQEK